MRLRQCRGGGRLTVTAGVTGTNEEATITITDSGSGIATEDLPHIFEPFFTTKKDGKGVGLGLSVVYGIIERHGGRITVTSVQSTQGKGTTFILTLPRAQGAAVRENIFVHSDEAD